MQSNDQYVREVAYYLWVSEGKPEGEADRHWQRASKMASESHLTGQAPEKRSVDPSEAKGKTEPAQPDQT